MLKGLAVGLLVVLCPPIGLIMLGLMVWRIPTPPGEVSPEPERGRRRALVAPDPPPYLHGHPRCRCVLIPKGPPEPKRETSGPKDWTSPDAYLGHASSKPR